MYSCIHMYFILCAGVQGAYFQSPRYGSDGGVVPQAAKSNKSDAIRAKSSQSKHLGVLGLSALIPAAISSCLHAPASSNETFEVEQT